MRPSRKNRNDSLQLSEALKKNQAQCWYLAFGYINISEYLPESRRCSFLSDHRCLTVKIFLFFFCFSWIDKPLTSEVTYCTFEINTGRHCLYRFLTEDTMTKIYSYVYIYVFFLNSFLVQDIDCGCTFCFFSFCSTMLSFRRVFLCFVINKDKYH